MGVSPAHVRRVPLDGEIMDLILRANELPSHAHVKRIENVKRFVLPYSKLPTAKPTSVRMEGSQCCATLAQ